MAKIYPDESKRAKETTGCKNCSLAYPNEHERHCEAHEAVPLIVFDEGFCFQFQEKSSNQVTGEQGGIMKETYECSKLMLEQRRRRKAVAKIGISAGVMGVIFSWAVDMHIIESSIAQSSTLLTLISIASLVCIGLSIILHE